MIILNILQDKQYQMSCFFVHDIYVMVCIFSSNQKPLFVNLDLGFGNSTSKFSWFSQ